MIHHSRRSVFAGVALLIAVLAIASFTMGVAAKGTGDKQAMADSKSCVECHRTQSPALVMEWERSRHGQNGVGCLDCHGAEKTDVDGWTHHGAQVAVLVTPKDCSKCHEEECQQFAGSHHAKAGQILASLDNVLAEKVAGMPNNNADAVNGCWQCHGAMVKLQRDKNGEPLRDTEGKPLIDPTTWPNSGMGRMNLDGSEGSCHACHSRHSFDVKLARSPENCGKCHMGPDHPQIEIYNESKHGIAFYANRNRMALDKEGDWVLGRDYSAAPTCATCHISSYVTPTGGKWWFGKIAGTVKGNTHDVGERISWTLRPAISKKQNLVVFADGQQENYPEERALPKPGDTVSTVEKVVENEKLVTKPVTRVVEKVVVWENRRKEMQGVCKNCHDDQFIGNFYQQYDGLVALYNDKFAKPATKLIADLVADSVLRSNAPFEHEVQWTYWELWHHEGRRARHGASMMGPDYTHWHGMYEVSKHFYTKFLPQVVEAAAEKSPAMKKKYEQIVAKMLTQDEHIWMKGLSAKEAEELRKTYKARYGE